MLKVLTYNIWEGGRGRVEELAAVIRGHEPDAVALQEVTSAAEAERLARVLGLDLFLGESAGCSHLAWLCRLPVRRSANHPLPVLAKTLLELEVDWRGERVLLFATHLASSHEETAHPRVEEVGAILQSLARHDGSPHLLAGDLNALAPGDPAVPPAGVEPKLDALPGAPRRTVGRLVDAGYVDCWRRLHPNEPGFTYPAHEPWLRLDYVFASPDLAARLAACEVIGTPPARHASDHLPVVATFGSRPTATISRR